jgi:Bacteriophage Gp15 protein
VIYSSFNVLLDTPPAIVWRGLYGDESFKTDFKQVLKFFRMLDDKELTDEERLYHTAIIFWGDVTKIPNDKDIWAKISSFIACRQDDKPDTTSTNEKKIMDYNKDHGRIFASFLQAYGIDLTTTNLHWWVFCELLQALPEDTVLMKVIDIRGRKITKHDTPEYKKQLRKLQRQFAIDDNGETALTSFFNKW